MLEPTPTPIYTLGHSNHTSERFLELLDQHDISVLVDTRSVPHSAYSQQFNREVLGHRLERAGVRYLWMGDALGGKPEDPSLYATPDVPDYPRMAEAPLFREAVARLAKGARIDRIALMCGEEDPTGCHRRLLVGSALIGEGLQVAHIRGDGTVEPEDPERLRARLAVRGAQLGLLTDDGAEGGRQGRARRTAGPRRRVGAPR